MNCFGAIGRLAVSPFCFFAALALPAQAQWQSYPAPWSTPSVLFGRDTQPFVVLDAPGTGGRILLAGGVRNGANGFYRSLDNGRTWQSNSLRLGDGTAAVAPMLPVVWAGTNPQSSGYPSHSGAVYASVAHVPADTLGNSRCDVLRSDDLGSTWSVVLRDTMACIITIDPSAPQRMYALEVGYETNFAPRILRSLDGGGTWQTLAYPGEAPSVVRVAANGTVYAVAESLYVSTDHGDTWHRSASLVQSADPGFQQPSMRDLVPWRHPQFGDSFAVAATSDGIYVTPDAGASWTLAGLKGFAFDTLDIASDSPVAELQIRIGFARRSGLPGHAGLAMLKGNSIVPLSNGLYAISQHTFVPKGGSFALFPDGLSICENLNSCIGGILPALTTVVEFHNSTLDHYFITPDSAEAAGIDAGAAGPGWSRTGQSFRIYANLADTPVLTTPVCRFYGTPGIGPNSHFFTANTDECMRVAADDRGWTLETTTAFANMTPQSNCAISGGVFACHSTCASGIPVYRLYNNRFAENDSNHRYVVDPTLYQSMQTQGWIGEDVRLCAVQ